MKYYYILCVSCLLLTACTLTPSKKNEQPQTGYQVVWADDDSEIAVVQLLNDADRNTRHQVFHQAAEADASRQAISKIRDYPSGRVYYMKSKGYLIVESFPDPTHVRFDKIFADGAEITILETRGEAIQCTASSTSYRPQMIPSPDGQLLAYLYHQECDQFTVDFLRASDLITLDSQMIDDLSASSVDGLWHPNGSFIVYSDKQQTAWQLLPEQSPESINYPDCRSPKTSSSDISSDAIKVSIDIENKLHLEPTATNKVFGCY